MTIELKPLAIVTVDLGKPQVLANTPKGTRTIVGITAAKWEGERLNATQQEGPAGDWALVGSDGTLSIDVRCTIVTHDGALIYVSYQGRSDYTKIGVAPFLVAPTFETGDPRYAWLNKVQAVGRGRLEGAGRLVYEICEML